jgi:hypothetical protein
MSIFKNFKNGLQGARPLIAFSGPWFHYPELSRPAAVMAEMGGLGRAFFLES